MKLVVKKEVRNNSHGVKKKIFRDILYSKKNSRELLYPITKKKNSGNYYIQKKNSRDILYSITKEISNYIEGSIK